MLVVADARERAGSVTADTGFDLKHNSRQVTEGPSRAGACGGQYTANTMAMAFEVMGICPPVASYIPAQNGAKREAAKQAGRLAVDVLRRGLQPSAIITRESLENAIAAVATSGGSTHAVLHLLAVA